MSELVAGFLLILVVLGTSTFSTDTTSTPSTGGVRTMSDGTPPPPPPG